MDEREWSSPEAANATRASLGGCFSITLIAFGVLALIAFAVTLIQAWF